MATSFQAQAQAQGQDQIVYEPTFGINMVVLILFHSALHSVKLLQSKIEFSDRMPASEYHERSALPAMVDGTILMLDLKKSESIFRKGAEWNRGGSLASIILTNICNFLNNSGGTVIQAEGDAVIVLWERGASANFENIPSERSPRCYRHGRSAPLLFPLKT